ncbi:MAG: P-II family nitrogen regulator [Desulfuromonadaceae bacterium]|nr:P-II family nitrogen regulator [Desulfuromonadaceae bacterium]
MIIAIVRNQVLENLEGRLVDMHVKGMSVTKVKGYGEYANFFNPDWMVTHTRVEIITESAKVEAIVDAIMDTAHTSMSGDGIVAVLPVEKLYRIRTKSEVMPDEI